MALIHGAHDRNLLDAFDSFFASCHLFIPFFDLVYDTYESLMEQSPWIFDVILAIAGKIRRGICVKIAVRAKHGSSASNLIIHRMTFYETEVYTKVQP